MGAFDLKQKTIHHPNWEDGEEVVIRELTYGEASKIANVAMSDLTMGDASDQDKLSKIRMERIDLGRPQLETLKACIVSWTLKKNGKTAPISYENVASLPAIYGDFIMEEIEKLNPEPDDKFQGTGGDLLPVDEGEVAS